MVCHCVSSDAEADVEAMIAAGAHEQARASGVCIGEEGLAGGLWWYKRRWWLGSKGLQADGERIFGRSPPPSGSISERVI